MKKYKRNYLEAFNYSEGDQILSEITGTLAHDIHHIQARGMGGSHGKAGEEKDHADNLIALSRVEHDIIEDDNVYYRDWLKMIHNLYKGYNMCYEDIYRTTKLADPTHIDPIYEEFKEKIKRRING